LQGRGGQALDGPGGEAALELAAAQQHIEPVARQGDAHAAVVVGIRGRFDERLGFQALDEGGRGGPGDAEMAGDLTGAGTVEVAPGEVLGLVGPNGAGKTTTLRSLVGIVRPTRGSISIGGRDLDRDPVGAKRQLAFMPDEPRLFDYLTVEEHLRFTGRLYDVRDAEARIPALLRELELAEKAGALPDELSRGMKQKLAIACGLLHEPKALLFDEPLTGLDPAGMRRMKETIVERARQGAAVMLSSHLLHLVEEV